MSAMLTLFSEFDRLEVEVVGQTLWVRSRGEFGQIKDAIALTLDRKDRAHLRAALDALDALEADDMEVAA